MRGRAYNRAQRQRAQARAHHLVANVLQLRGDNPSNRWEVPADECERLTLRFSVDRKLGRNYFRGESRQEQRAARDEREQVQELHNRDN